MDGWTQREGRVAVEGVEHLVLHLADGVAVEHTALNLLLELLRCQRNSLNKSIKKERKKDE